MPAKGQERMDQQASIWTPHLKPGERIVWSASASAALRSADISRRRILYGLAGGASAIVAVLLAIRFFETIFPAHATPNLGAAVAAPLYLAFALAMAALAVWGFRNLNPKLSAAMHFAATDARLIALDASGKVVDEMPGPDVDGVIAGGRRKTPDLYVLRAGDEKEERVFAIEHIDKPLEAKAIIEENFLDASGEAE